MKWEIMSGQLTGKSGQIKYHVRCKYCRTVRILTKEETQENCECNKEKYNDEH